MEEVSDPRELFTEIDATDVPDDGEFEFYVAPLFDVPAVEEDGEIPRQKGEERKCTIEHEDLSDEELDRQAAFDALREGPTAESEDEFLRDRADTKFSTEEATYYCDTQRLGYKLISDKDPLEGGYAVVHSESVLRVEE